MDVRERERERKKGRGEGETERESERVRERLRDRDKHGCKWTTQNNIHLHWSIHVLENMIHEMKGIDQPSRSVVFVKQCKQPVNALVKLMTKAAKINKRTT